MKARGGFGSDYVRAFNIVDLPRECPQVKDAENCHFNAEEE